MPRWLYGLVILLLVVSTIAIIALLMPLTFYPVKYWLALLQYQVLTIPLATTAIVLLLLVYLQLVRRFDTHKGIRAIAQRERPFDACQTWSTHLGSPILKSLRWRLKGLVLFWKPKDEFLRVLEHKADREVVNILSLNAFETLLREHGTNPGVLIISTSLLNRLDRSTTRLQRRIETVRNQTGWRHVLVVRDLGAVLSAASRFQFGWMSVPGEIDGHFLAPGLIAWRAADGDMTDDAWRCRLKRLKLRIATETDLQSPIFRGMPRSH